MQHLTIGSTLQEGKYRIEKVLGQGGFGITYLATHTFFEKKVAIKEFFYKDYCEREESTSRVSMGTQSNHELVERFLQKFIKEARTISKLDHPHIVHIQDIFKENNTAYYVMDYIEGESLSDRVKRQGALPEAEAISYIKQVASALDFIHEQSINHLDVKPANIMVRKADDRVILIDYGLSKQYDEQGGQTSSTPVGISHGYAPMEQYNVGGVSTFTPQTDIYSLGATLYKLVTGQTPPQAIEMFNEGFPTMPSHISVGTITAIEKAMQPSKKLRPANVAAFLALLTDEEETTVIVEPVKPQQTVNEETGILPPSYVKTKEKTEKKVELRESPRPSVTLVAEKKEKKHIGMIACIVLCVIGALILFIGKGNCGGRENVEEKEIVTPQKPAEEPQPASIMNSVAVVEIVEPDTDSLRFNSQNITEKRNGYIKYENGTILDEKRKIMWMTKDYMSIEGHALPNASWHKAVDWCEKINKQHYAGYNDWRIPTVKELLTLARPASQREFYRSFFEESGADYFWSNNSISNYVKSYVDMKDGVATSGDSEGQRNFVTKELFKFSVRLVRNID